VSDSPAHAQDGPGNPGRLRVVHAADLHLDSPLRGLGRLSEDQLSDGDLADTLRRAPRVAFDNLVGHCLRTLPAALVLAGDLYDGDWSDYSTGVYFTGRMRDLCDVGVHVVLLQGNHDAKSVITRSLTLPPTVTVLPTEAPGTRVFDDLGLAVHGQGFADSAVMRNLALDYPDPVPGMVNIGLLHTSVQGYAGHDPYAPCSVTDLTGSGYEYFALGHIHARRTLAEGATTVAFSGNLQGRHARETGPKGALEVALAPGEQADVEFLTLDAARWEAVEVDLGTAADEAQAYDLVDEALGRTRHDAGTRPVVARVLLTGTSPLAGRFADSETVGHEIRPRAARHEVAVEKIRSQVVTPADHHHMPAEQRARLERIVAQVLADPRSLYSDTTFPTDLDALRSEFRQHVSKTDLDLTSDDNLAELVREACDMLLARADGGEL
jgi:DNA repair protein SbcD/Mre11